MGRRFWPVVQSWPGPVHLLPIVAAPLFWPALDLAALASILFLAHCRHLSWLLAVLWLVVCLGWHMGLGAALPPTYFAPAHAFRGRARRMGEWAKRRGGEETKRRRDEW